MTSELRRSARRIFLSVVEQVGSERAARIAALCGGDPALREEVEGLLAADDDSFLERSAQQVARIFDEELEVRGEQKVEGYEIVREIGRGGMGVVYEARELALNRVVALKFLRGGHRPADELVRRFHDEMRILARLNHPGIVPIYATGASAEGRPFFAMELVDGTPLMDHVTRHAVPLQDRLVLLAQICDAVSYAHQNGVIHRDLKPSNLLVSPRAADAGDARVAARVRVLDFGLSLMTQDAEPGPVAAAYAGTLTYMSPEQAAGEARVDVRSDIYSLGMILHQLVLGELPFDLAGVDPLQLFERVRAFRVDVGELRRRGLDAELAAMVAKALAHDPARRYQSAAALGEDIARYRARLPLLAVPPSAAYHLRKLIVRNLPLTVVAGGVLVLMCAGGLLWAWRERVNARAVAEQRDAALVSATNHAAVVEFLCKMLSSVGPGRGAGFSTAAVGGYPIEGRDVRLIDVIAQASSMLATEPIEDPLSVAMIRQSLAVAWRALGNFAHAETQMRSALTAFRADPASCKSTFIAEEQLALALIPQNKLAEADALLWSAYQGKQELLGLRSRETLLTLKNIGVLRQQQGRSVEAEQILRQVLERCRGQGGDSDLRAADVMSVLAVIGHARGDRRAAFALARAAYTTQRERLTFDHPETLTTANNYALMLFADGQPLAAYELLSEVFAAQQRVLGPDHIDTLATSANLASCLVQLGRGREATEQYRRTSESLRRNLGEDHPMVLKTDGIYGQLLLNGADELTGEALVRRALDGQRAAYHGKFHPDILANLEPLAGWLSRHGRFAESQALFEEMLAGWTQVGGRQHRKAIEAINYLAGVRLARNAPGDAIEAEALAREALWRASLPDPLDGPEQRVRRLRIEANLCRALIAVGCADEACERARVVVQGLRKVAVDGTPGLQALLWRCAEQLDHPRLRRERFELLVLAYALQDERAPQQARLEVEAALLCIYQSAAPAVAEQLQQVLQQR